jgi:hypothetical protein
MTGRMATVSYTPPPSRRHRHSLPDWSPSRMTNRTGDIVQCSCGKPFRVKSVTGPRGRKKYEWRPVPWWRFVLRRRAAKVLAQPDPWAGF